jgi:transcriptional regulator with XRE-family HTH domain
MHVKAFLKICAIFLKRRDAPMYTERLRNLREDKDEKQEAIAMLLRITRQQYQLYESGKRKLPVDFLPILCRHFNISADYLLGLIDGPLSYIR